MKTKQMYMVGIGVLGVFGIQIGLYELVKGAAFLPIIYGMLIVGSFLALKGFKAYRQLEED